MGNISEMARSAREIVIQQEHSKRREHRIRTLMDDAWNIFKYHYNNQSTEDALPINERTVDGTIFSVISFSNIESSVPTIDTTVALGPFSTHHSHFLGNLKYFVGIYCYPKNHTPHDKPIISKEFIFNRREVKEIDCKQSGDPDAMIDIIKEAVQLVKKSHPC